MQSEDTTPRRDCNTELSCRSRGAEGRSGVPRITELSFSTEPARARGSICPLPGEAGGDLASESGILGGERPSRGLTAGPPRNAHQSVQLSGWGVAVPSGCPAKCHSPNTEPGNECLSRGFRAKLAGRVHKYRIWGKRVSRPRAGGWEAQVLAFCADIFPFFCPYVCLSLLGVAYATGCLSTSHSSGG